MGGIEPNTIYTIVGCTGSGKSSLLTTLQADLFDLNSEAPIVMLSFSFEMLSSRNVGRIISYKTKKTTTELYSGQIDFKLSDEDAQRSEEVAKNVSKYNIYYIEKPCSVEEMRKSIEYFQQTIAKDK
jgi:replicative DNA helicase